MKSKVFFGDIAKFSNGKSSPERNENAKFCVFGSNGIIGKSNETNAKEETIIIGRVGSYCGSVYFSKDKCWVTDNAIKCEAKDNNIPLFIYYQSLFLNLNNFRVGSGQPLLNQGILNSLEINYVEPKQQKKIAHILSTLDDKIELNRKMNKTLEDMASAIFKSWFVDFDPVHAKANCTDEKELENIAKELGISKDILDLFPSEFEESELGMIPKGWRIGNFENDCRIVYGKNLPTTKLTSSGYNVYGGNGIIGFYDKYLYEQQQILIGCRGAASGVVHLSNPKSYVTNNSLVIELNNDNELNFEYMSELAKNTDFSIYRSGSAQPQITIQSINIHKFLIPSRELLKHFRNTISYFQEKILINSNEILTLQKTRDTLLPKLLSGEIKVEL
ncbi:MAG: restriction endonuclease subunit S [Aliarcobacter butzleri]|nr:restriction endonuclease subunit S [Aliarcobacter butzleri]